MREELQIPGNKKARRASRLSGAEVPMDSPNAKCRREVELQIPLSANLNFRDAEERLRLDGESDWYGSLKFHLAT